MMRRVRDGVLILLGISLGTGAWSESTAAAAAETYRTSEWLKAELAEYVRDPLIYRDRIPVKRDASGRRLGRPDAPFSEEERIRSHGPRVERDRARRRIIESAALPNGWESERSFLAPLDPSGNEGLLEEFIESEQSLSSLAEIESAGLTSGRLETMPWADHYWPYYSGLLGSRYADPDFPRTFDWMENFKYVRNLPALSVFASGNAAHIDQLSPSEKYDLLIGTETTPLTDALWKSGEAYYRRSGNVESWMGICHGWAAASIMKPSPLQKVDVLAADGKTRLTFYPADVKALISLLWANTRVPTHFLGGRCDTKNPRRDENGRVTDPECFDSNPAVWHLAVVNRLGAGKKSLVLDASFDYEVWNQPLYSYSYTYFNPRTKQPARGLEEARVRVADFGANEDSYRRYRSSDAEWIVGIGMELEYIVEGYPVQSSYEEPESSPIRTVRYMYDLELDREGRVIGGEWYTNAHPDFLWAPVAGAEARSAGDYYLLGQGLWSGVEAVPANWRRPGGIASTRGQPLERIVESLVQLSRRKEEGERK